MPRRMLWKGEVEEFFSRMRSTEPRRVLSEEEALAWHREQGERQARERARMHYYLVHDSGSPHFAGDHEEA